VGVEVAEQQHPAALLECQYGVTQALKCGLGRAISAAPGHARRRWEVRAANEDVFGAAAAAAPAPRAVPQPQPKAVLVCPLEAAARGQRPPH
jgi:hypothetical protein